MSAWSGVTNPGCAAVPPAAEMHGWQLLDPIPDQVGYGGMCAGVLNDRLVAAGGSQFRDRPLWLKGEKVFSDRIFTLAAMDGKWVESKTRLPEPVASAAAAATREVIYLAGGVSATACSQHVWAMRAKREGFDFSALPDLPQPVGYGAAAIVGQRLYVVGGLDAPSSKEPSRAVWSLAVDGAAARATWRREPDLPGEGVFVAAAASDGRSLYVFGGIGFDGTGKPVPSARAYALQAEPAGWTRLPDLPGPRVGISSPCPLVPGDKFMLVGGYDEVFPGAPREHPGFSAQTLYFDVAARHWANGPLLPRAPVPDRDAPGDAGPAPMIGAPCVVWHDHVVIPGGEVRSSVRTTAVLAWPLRGNASPAR
jgi:N-acetylneuraminate epimerase